MRGKDREREDFALYISLSFPTLLLLFLFSMIPMTTAAAVSETMVVMVLLVVLPLRIQTARVFLCKKIVVLTLNYCFTL